MGNTISDYYSDEDIIAELRTYFEYDEMWSINFQSLLKSIIDYNDIYYMLQIKNRTFYINKITCEVMEK